MTLSVTPECVCTLATRNKSFNPDWSQFITYEMGIRIIGAFLKFLCSMYYKRTGVESERPRFKSQTD